MAKASVNNSISNEEVEDKLKEHEITHTDGDDLALGFPEKHLTKGKYWFPGKDELTEREWNIKVYGKQAVEDAENLQEKLGKEYDKYCLHVGQPFLPEFDMTPEEKKKYNDSFEGSLGYKLDMASALKPIALMKHACGLDNDPNAAVKLMERFQIREDYSNEEKEKREALQKMRHEMYSSWAEEIKTMKVQPEDPTIPSQEELKFFKEVLGMEWTQKKTETNTEDQPTTDDKS